MPLSAALNSSGYEIFGLDVVELSDIWKQIVLLGQKASEFAKLILPDQASPNQTRLSKSHMRYLITWNKL